MHIDTYRGLSAKGFELSIGIGSEQNVGTVGHNGIAQPIGLSERAIDGDCLQQGFEIVASRLSWCVLVSINIC